MSKDYLPAQVNPFRFAENSVHLHGSLPIKGMSRLVASLASPEGEVFANIQFGTDDQGIKFIKGQVKAPLNLQCQRCMNSFVYEIISDFVYGLVLSEEEAAELPGNYDPLISEDGNLNVHEMVEEEVILNLPIVSMHDSKDCNVTFPVKVSDKAYDEAEAKKESPFKVIELLKKTKTEK